MQQHRLVEVNLVGVNITEFNGKTWLVPSFPIHLAVAKLDLAYFGRSLLSRSKQHQA